MHELFLRVKGIVKKNDKYLIVKRWMDDRIPDPFFWEFVDGEVGESESPDEAVLRQIRETLGVEGTIDRILYTWAGMLGETHMVGIAYLCSTVADDSQFVLSEDFGEWTWVTQEEFEEYIENKMVLEDLKKNAKKL